MTETGEEHDMGKQGDVRLGQEVQQRDNNIQVFC